MHYLTVVVANNPEATLSNSSRVIDLKLLKLKRVRGQGDSNGWIHKSNLHLLPFDREN